MGTCETSQVLLADVSGGLCSGFSHLLIGPSHMSGNYLERGVQLNQKYSKQYFGELVTSPNILTNGRAGDNTRPPAICILYHLFDPAALSHMIKLSPCA